MFFERLLRTLQRYDWLLLLCVFVLFAFGLSAIYSVELSQESANFLLLKKQLIAFLLGVTLMFLASRSNHLLLRNYGRGLYLFGLVLLVLVLFFGKEIRGTTGWFDFGWFSFQPVEFMKLALCVELARYFGEHARRRFGWRDIFGSGLLVALPVALTMQQPDLGSSILLIGIWLVVIFFAGLRVSHASVLIGLALASSILAWFFYLDVYQKERIYVFLDPARDALVRGYNITQAKIAIGSGQLFGRGLGFGSQSQLKFLPESQTDFVFAVIAEELGFIGILILFLALAVLCWRILHAAKISRDNFTAFLALAIFGALFVQSVVNIGVDLAVLPATGVALPLVSYGGSSLILTLVMLGVVESIYLSERSRGRLVSPPRSE